MEFSIGLKNGCNTGNKVTFADPSQTEIETVQIMSEWSSRVIDLPQVFTDQFSEDGGLGSCGNLTFELKDNDEKGVIYTFVSLNEEGTQLTINS